MIEWLLFFMSPMPLLAGVITCLVLIYTLEDFIFPLICLALYMYLI